ncbi:MAG: Crp/Fnr family transcriptional regulator [Chloroflexi bacterium]|nr:Crp/Fnr family transcriptional regulator [Chloroflexota bacterium]
MNDPQDPPSDIIGFLHNTPLFRDLDERVIRRLAYAGWLKRVPKGEVIFLQSDPPDSAYIVRSGSVAIVLTSTEGRELVINEMRSGDCFGEMGVITGRAHSADAIAREASEILVIPRQALLDALEQEPTFTRRLLETTAARLNLSSERESALAFLDAQARLARVLLQLDRESSANGYVTISQEELAGRSSLTRQTVAKTLGRWRRAGWLLTGRGKIVLLNRPALKRWIQQQGI